MDITIVIIVLWNGYHNGHHHAVAWASQRSSLRLSSSCCEMDITAVIIVLLSYLVGGLSPVSRKGLHQGWTQNSLYHQVIHFKSHSTTSPAFWAYSYSAGTRHGNLYPTGGPTLFCGPTLEFLVATADTGKNRKSFWKNAGEWTGRLEISKEEILGSKHSM